MTALAGAPSTRFTHWKVIDWKKVENQVKRLQLRIAKAIKLGRYAKAKTLQWLLSHSFFAKLLAIKRVTQNAGKRTPGVDGVIWKTDKQKMAAAHALKRKGYKAQPLRRIYIPKKNRKLRPLGIPTKADRDWGQAWHFGVFYCLFFRFSINFNLWREDTDFTKQMQYIT